MNYMLKAHMQVDLRLDKQSFRRSDQTGSCQQLEVNISARNFVFSVLLQTNKLPSTYPKSETQSQPSIATLRRELVETHSPPQCSRCEFLRLTTW